MTKTTESRLDQLLDLLAEEVADRLESRSLMDRARADQGPLTGEAHRPAEGLESPPQRSAPAPQSEPMSQAAVKVEPDPEPADAETASELAPPPLPPTHTARLLGRLALGLLAVLILINIPITRHGTTLATAMPDRRALVIRDGLVVKEADAPEIYVYDGGRFRWISSLTAFETLGYAWQDVHIVEGGFLAPYAIGPPVHVILKCPDSPHIYLLEGEEKQWIVDIEAFEAEGYVWEDVHGLPCDDLRSLPDGETIPPGHGPPPQP